MYRIFFALVLFYSASRLTVMGATQLGEKATHNVFKLNYGPGLVYSKIYDFVQHKVYKSSTSLDLSLEYAHTWTKGWGIGFNLIQSHLNSIGCNDLYVGPCLYYGRTVNHRWYYDWHTGFGYAANDYAESKNGIGLTTSTGMHYKINKHIGAGGEINLLSTYYRKPTDWDTYTKEDGPFGTARITLAIGIHYYF